VFITLSLLGGLLGLVWRSLGGALVLAASLALFVTATPAISSYLTHQIESRIPNDTAFGDAQAIVVLGADVQSGAGTGSDRLGPLSFERLIFAVDAYRHLHLPVAVSGGRTLGSRTSVAQLMKNALENYLAVPVTWSEERSRTTYENALYTSQLLKAQ